MKFGSIDWFYKLNEMVSFPAKFAFYYNKRDNVIQVSKVNSKAMVENIRYRDIEPSPLHFHPKETALIKVIEISSDKEYHDEIVQLQEIWRTKFAG
ncbi:hypothetical protein [Cytobacillus sp. IB215665]|uniref:hypothetical protein n=1 Tax=Cytobacillus sp. IB215665 TaxID=3097357 RepID=UPI002A17F0E1|nr:hypothetical protein [Cytobacillus sp. IB215665]MDX8367890.1 hypothetical protein [Cytobacillus sp. IB215665]